MFKQRLALLALLAVGMVLGALIAGVPSVDPEMENQIDPRAGSEASDEEASPSGKAAADPRAAGPVEVAGAVVERRNPAEVRVKVLNASGASGAAGAVTADVAAMGYQTTTPDNTQPRRSTVVWAQPGYEADAIAVASVLERVPPVEPMPAAAVQSVDDVHVVLVLGGDHGDAGSGLSASG